MRNILQVLVFDVFGKGLLALMGALLIRYMPQREYVEYSVAYGALMVGVQFCSGSLNRIYIVGYERFHLQSRRAALVWLQLLAGSVGAAVVLAFLHRSPAGLITAAALIAGCVVGYAKGVFQREMRFLHFSLVELARALAVCGGVALLVWTAKRGVAAVQVLALQLCVAVALAAIAVPRDSALFHRGILSDVKALATRLLTGSYAGLLLYFPLLALFGQIDLFVLRAVAPERQVAAYASAFRYYNVLLLGLNAMNAVMLPLAQNMKSFGQLRELKKQHRRAMLLFLPGVVAAALAAGVFIPLVDGGKYPEAILVFRILALSSIVSVATSPFLNLVLAAEDFAFLSRCLCGAFAIAIAVNLLLGARYGAAGTAASVCLSTGFLNGMGWWRSLRYEQPAAPAIPPAANCVRSAS